MVRVIGGFDNAPEEFLSMEREFQPNGQLGLSQTRHGSARIVAVGDPVQWKNAGNSFPTNSEMRFVSFSDVGFDLLRECDPEFILSPVVANDFDCIDLAVLLCRLGYKRPYRAVSDDLPSPEIIEREIRQLCPDLDFAVARPV